MTGPNPDAELDEALGVAKLPPAAVTDDHLARAIQALFPMLHVGVHELDQLASAYAAQIRRIAQAIADAEQRGAARVIAEHAAAGT